MSFNEDKDIRRMIILDHYENPKYFVSEKQKIDSSYQSFNNNSPTCIDNITAYIKFNKDKIVDIKLQGIGCAIATSSTDIMASMLIGKSIKQANQIINNYLDMIAQKKFNEKQLQDLYVFSNVNKQVNRINCAKVGILAIKNALNNDKK